MDSIRKLKAANYFNERYASKISEDYLAGVMSGVEWADSNPNDELINNILWIWEHSDISHNEDVNTNDYIREHLFDKK